MAFKYKGDNLKDMLMNFKEELSMSKYYKII